MHPDNRKSWKQKSKKQQKKTNRQTKAGLDMGMTVLPYNFSSRKESVRFWHILLEFFMQTHIYTHAHMHAY